MLTTKLHAIVLEDRLPPILTLTPGHWSDAPWVRWLLERLGPISGQPQLLADALEGDEMRALSAELGWKLITPPKSIRRQTWPLKRAAYRARNVIERYFGRIKGVRGIAIRYHKLAHVYFNQILLACIHFMTN